MKRTLVWVAAIIVALIILIVAVFYGGLRSAEQAELNLIYRCLAFDVVGQYVQASEGKWPRSWEDLAATKLERRGSISPKELEELKDRVHIRFDVELKDVLLGGVENFDAIQSKGPSYHEGNKFIIEKFLEKLGKFGIR
jgi:hypothetical protein